MPQQASPTTEESLRQARELGRREAEALERRLRDDEDADREKRWTELHWTLARKDADESAAPYEVSRLHEHIEELEHYVQAVESSVVWRLAQWLRGLFGRAW